MSDKMREEFEQEWSKVRGRMPERSIAIGGQNSYVNMIDDAAWWAWQASRESLVVELPSLHPAMNTACDNYRSWMNCFRACKKAIESLGLRVKP